MAFGIDINGESLLPAKGEHGGLIPASRLPAFSLYLPEDLPIPLLIGVPHAGRDYPDALTQKMRDPEYSKIRLEDRYVDKIAVEISRLTGAGLLVAHAPRAMLDLNRATNDVDWDMVAGVSPDGAKHSAANRRARSGLGLVPRRLPGLGEIWNARISGPELSARIRQIHSPYHSALTSGLQRLRDHWGAALLIDLHSMPPLKKTHSDDIPANFVIGDRFGSAADERLIASALRYFARNGQSVAHNRPYAGGFILDQHAKPEQQIHAFQLEICRTLYLERSMTDLSGNCDQLAKLLAGFVRQLGEITAQLGRSKTLMQAAE